MVLFIRPQADTPGSPAKNKEEKIQRKDAPFLPQPAHRPTPGRASSARPAAQSEPWRPRQSPWAHALPSRARSPARSWSSLKTQPGILQNLSEREGMKPSSGWRERHIWGQPGRNYLVTFQTNNFKYLENSHSFFSLPEKFRLQIWMPRPVK